MRNVQHESQSVLKKTLLFIYLRVIIQDKMTVYHSKIQQNNTNMQAKLASAQPTLHCMKK